MSSLENELLQAANITYIQVVPTKESTIEILYKYINPLFLLCGTVGNTLSFIIMHKMSLKVWSTCLYLTILSLLDLTVLYVDCGNKWYTLVTQQDLSRTILTSSQAMCKVYTFFYNFVLNLTAWITVAMTVECFISIRFPILKYKMCTKEHARAVILLIAVILVGINIHFFWTHGLILPSESKILQFALCIYINEFSDIFRDHVWQFLNLFVQDIIPIILISLLITVAVIVLLTKKKETKRMDCILKKYYMDLESFHEMRQTVLIIAIIYICSTLPKAIITIFRYFVVTYKQIPFSSEFYMKLKTATEACNMIDYANRSMKIFVYLFSCQRIYKWTKRMAYKALMKTVLQMNWQHHASFSPEQENSVNHESHAKEHAVESDQLKREEPLERIGLFAQTRV